MTQEQLLGAVRWIVSAGGGYAVGKGWITSDQVVLISGIAIAIVPLIWSFWANSQKSQVKAAGNIQGVVVSVDRSAPSSVQDVAKDTSSNPNVVMKP